MLADWGLEVDVDLDAGRLTVEQRQIVEIARALLQGTRFIILDEPTAELEGREVARLFERIARLQEGGVTFLYISHHLEEIYEICRNVTVLRDGKVVANAPLDDHAQGARGRRDGRRRGAGAMAGAAGAPGRRAPGGLPAWRCAGFASTGAALDLSFTVAAGEMRRPRRARGLGQGGGRAMRSPAWSTPSAGEISVAGTPLRPGLVIDARRKGVGYVPRDRHRRGIVPQLSLAENLTMTIVERLGPRGSGAAGASATARPLA